VRGVGAPRGRWVVAVGSWVWFLLFFPFVLLSCFSVGFGRRSDEHFLCNAFPCLFRAVFLYVEYILFPSTAMPVLRDTVVASSGPHQRCAVASPCLRRAYGSPGPTTRTP